MRITGLFYITVVVTLAVGGVFEVLHVQQVDEARLCESSLKVRQPLETYIASEVRIVNEAKARGIPLGPPALAKLQAQSFANLVNLNAALKDATATGCDA